MARVKWLAILYDLVQPLGVPHLHRQGAFGTGWGLRRRRWGLYRSRLGLWRPAASPLVIPRMPKPPGEQATSLGRIPLPIWFPSHCPGRTGLPWGCYCSDAATGSGCKRSLTASGVSWGRVTIFGAG